MPGNQLEPADRRPDDDGRRVARMAAPWLVGGLTAVVAGLTSTLDVLNLPVEAGVGITVVVSVIAGLVAWATQRAAGAPDEPKPRGRGVEPGNVPPAQLPPVVTHFTGRGEVLDELREVFGGRARRRPHRDDPGMGATPLVVSIHGPAGVGKSALATRFAHEIAQRFPDGQLYFDLRGTAEVRVSPEDVLTGFLLALGVRLSTDPGGLPELQKLWWTWVRDRRLLIYLDNAVDGDQVQALLPSDAGCAVIVTSRQPLYIRTSYDKRLPAFSESQGVELLARLAGDERIAADAQAAVDIVELCGHLPLAISICGGRLAAREHWSLRDLADRLGDERRRRLDELEIGVRISQSVRASLKLSYDDCTDVQRRLLRAFGLVAAPDIPGWVAGELLGTSELDGVDQLEALVDAQLVEYSATDATGARRYRLHDLVRLYAAESAEREDSEEQRRTALVRVIDGYRDRAEEVAASRWPQDWHRKARPDRTDRTAAGEPSAMDWLTSERLALLAILRQSAELETWRSVWRLSRAFCSLCHSMRMFWSDWLAVAEICCDAAGRLDDRRALGIALLERAAVVGGMGQLERALDDGRQALDLLRGLRETWWAARANRLLGVTLRNAGNLDAGQQYLLEAIEGFRTEGDSWWHARTQRNLAELRSAQRSYDQARELLEDSLRVFRRDGNRYSEAQTERALGEIIAAEAHQLSTRGAHREAHVKYTMAALTLERAAERFRLRGEGWEEARCLRAAGSVGQPGNGLRELTFVKRAKDMLAGLGDSWGVARTSYAEGEALSRLDRPAEAIDAVREAVLAYRELGDRWWEARCLRGLAELLVQVGERADAEEHAERALEIYRSLGNESGVSRAREVLARTRDAV
ncbi:ATP-binding protein [Flindersiella endophytica]